MRFSAESQKRQRTDRHNVTHSGRFYTGIVKTHAESFNVTGGADNPLSIVHPILVRRKKPFSFHSLKNE